MNVAIASCVSSKHFEISSLNLNMPCLVLAPDLKPNCKGSDRLCISRPQHATSLLKVARRGSTAEKCMYLAFFDISSCSASSSVDYEQLRWEVVWCGSDGVDEDALRALIASYRDTLYDYSWLRYSVSL